MLDQQLVTNIRESGHTYGAAEMAKRDGLVRREMGFRVADRAEYALISSCFLPTIVPDDMKAFRNILHYLEVDYSLLPRERCCGDLLYHQALKDKSGEELKQADKLGKEFLEDNVRQARELGASKIVTYCLGCDLAYGRTKDSVSMEVMWHPSLLAPLFRGGRLELQADYYVGCLYFYRRLNNTLPDLDSPMKILSRIEGLELDYLDNHLCCTRPQQMERLLPTIKNRTIITVCASCALYLREALKDKGDYRVVMLSQVMWAAMSSEPL